MTRSWLPTTRVAALTVAAAVALTACGPAGDSSAPTDGDDTRTVTDQFGEVTITGTPERIVAPGAFETDILLDLGITPLAIGRWEDAPDGIPPWRERFDGIHDIPQIGYNPDGYDVEETLAYNPDLVLVGSYIQAEEYQALSAAVPTVAPAYELSPEDQIRLVGEAINRQDDAERLITEQRELLETTRSAYPQLDGATIAVAWAGEPGTLMNFTDPGTLGFAELLGFRAAPGLAEIEPFARLSAEDWDAFDGDVFLVSFASAEVQAEFEADALFQRIPAVIDGRYIGEHDMIEFENLRASSPAQIAYSVEVFVPRLAGLLDQ